MDCFLRLLFSDIHVAEKFEEEMAKNPARMKQWLRWKKRGGDRENIGLEPEEDVQGDFSEW